MDVKNMLGEELMNELVEWILMGEDQVHIKWIHIFIEHILQLRDLQHTILISKTHEDLEHAHIVFGDEFLIELDQDIELHLVKCAGVSE